MYDDPQWNYSPMKATNNINGIGKVGKHEVYTIDKEPALLAVQKAMVRKIVDTLADAMQEALEAPINMLAKMGAAGAAAVNDRHDAVKEARQLADLFSGEALS